MKKLLLIPLLLLNIAASAQVMPSALITLSTVTDLRLQQPQATERVDLLGLSSATDGNGGIYTWNAASTTADDGFLTIQVTGISTGRWIRIGGGNAIKGSVIISGLSLTTTYAVSYPGGTLPFTPVTVIIIPRSLAAAGLSYVSAITTTGFTVNFVLAPSIGTSNINFDWVAIKQ